jgi:hypothetical protein
MRSSYLPSPSSLIAQSSQTISRITGRSRAKLSRAQLVIKRNLSRVLCLVLVNSMLSASTPAAPQTIVSLSTEWQSNLAFWYRASGWDAAVKRWMSGQPLPASVPQEQQAARDAQVSQIEIYPGDVTLQAGQSVVFAAVASDVNNTPVGGVHFTWHGETTESKEAVPVFSSGLFAPQLAGTYTITAEGAGQEAQVTVTVTEDTPHILNASPSTTREVSTRDLPQGQAALPRQERGKNRSALAKQAASTKRSRTSLAHTTTVNPQPLLPGDGWDNTNYMSADDPINRRGNPPGSPLDDGAGSGNFQLAAPVLALPGRGIDLALGLIYNSRVWNKTESTSKINFDIDRDWPAPGWSIGFGKVMGMGVDNGSMLVDADGTRHAYKGIVTHGPNDNYTDFVGHTIDGTFIDYKHHTGTGGALVSAQAKYPNGMVIEYTVKGTAACIRRRSRTPTATSLPSLTSITRGPKLILSPTLWGASSSLNTMRTIS